MEGNNQNNAKRGRSLLEWYEALVFAVIILVIAFSFAFRIIEVQGISMEPTLQNEDRLLVWGAGYTPADGDVVVLDGYIDFGKPLVKRIIATSGQTVDIDFASGDVTVDGQVLEESYIADRTSVSGDITFPLTVPEGKVFVMGDNRNHSTDSRFSTVGCIDERDVLGRVVFRITPLSKAGVIE